MGKGKNGKILQAKYNYEELSYMHYKNGFVVFDEKCVMPELCKLNWRAISYTESSLHKINTNFTYSV